MQIAEAVVIAHLGANAQVESVYKTAWIHVTRYIYNPRLFHVQDTLE